MKKKGRREKQVDETSPTQLEYKQKYIGNLVRQTAKYSVKNLNRGS